VTDKVKQLEEQIQRVENEIANLRDHASGLREKLEAARKEFRPFEVTIKVHTEAQARTLAAIYGRNGTVAESLLSSTRIAGKVTRNEMAQAIALLLRPFGQRVSYTGELRT